MKKIEFFQKASILLAIFCGTRIEAFVARSAVFPGTPTSSKKNAFQKKPLRAEPNSNLSSADPDLNKPPFRLQHIDHIVIRCHNFPSMFDFYHRILGCTIDESYDDHVDRFGGALTHLRAGSCYIDLLAYDTNHLNEEGKEAIERFHAGGSGMGEKKLQDIKLTADSSTLDHLCLRLEPFDEKVLQNYLEKENVPVVAMGEKRLGADGVGPSIYVRDPEGNVIELKGAPHHKQSQNEFGGEQNDGQGKTPSSSDKITGVSVPNSPPKEYQRKTQETNMQQKSTIQNTSNDIPSTPCTRICRYNASFYDGQVCIGCFREAYEIQSWQSMAPIEKSMALLDAIDRCSDCSKSVKSSSGEDDANSSFEGAISSDELTRQYEYWADLAKK